MTTRRWLRRLASALRELTAVVAAARLYASLHLLADMDAAAAAALAAAAPDGAALTHAGLLRPGATLAHLPAAVTAPALRRRIAAVATALVAVESAPPPPSPLAGLPGAEAPSRRLLLPWPPRVAILPLRPPPALSAIAAASTAATMA